MSQELYKTRGTASIERSTKENRKDMIPTPYDQPALCDSLFLQASSCGQVLYLLQLDDQNLCHNIIFLHVNFSFLVHLDKPNARLALKEEAKEEKIVRMTQ
ncbi:hypothetical protein MGYG_04707 [Nannizzia gypsea CBS 118893]|uniref:Uncharacterized protein n=1 Tax=Arthroderma gypseum (strain ATCC MYA-4604 / CBS 118893) TaxID=535722 RepID=E4UW96_ARTGP|nr:hypothetical protein MGYG_04707 [Nannizzia gypsea CBS 118893]EFR01704.1 hypothetical protein MGYG_04707 [Nannizzia gypsea CBS 118893]